MEESNTGKTAGKVIAFIIMGIAFAITLLANFISKALNILGAIPYVGFLFKILAIPFTLVGKLKKVLLIGLIIMLVVFVLFPLLAKIVNRIKLKKMQRENSLREEEVMNETVCETQDFPTAAKGPSKMDF